MTYTYCIEVREFKAYKNKWQWVDIGDIHKTQHEEDAIDAVQELKTDDLEPGSYRLVVKECNDNTSYIEGEDVVWEKSFERKTQTVWL